MAARRSRFAGVRSSLDRTSLFLVQFNYTSEILSLHEAQASQEALYENVCSLFADLLCYQIKSIEMIRDRSYLSRRFRLFRCSIDTL